MDPATRATAADEAADAWTRRRRRKAPIAAFLSFLFPGWGQFYNHQTGLAAIFALPIVGLLGLLAFAILTAREDLFAWLLDTRVIIGLMAINLIVLAWRLAAMLQAHRRRARLRPERIGTRVTAVLVLVAVLMHAAPMGYGLKLLETVNAVSLGGEQHDAGGARNAIPGFSGPSGEPLREPSGQPDIEVGERVNILLVGVDSGVGRDHALTDTMLLVSIDPGGDSAMLSIPRDIVNAPLPNGDPYPWKLNSLLQNASADPAGYPFGGGVATLKATISALLDVPVHYFAALDMAGFEQVIDSIGGVEVVVETAIADEFVNLYLQPGPVFMDGELALRYVRSRHGAGNNDFVRADRQQQVLAAIRAKLTQANLLTALPGLLDAVQNTIATDVPSDRIPELAAAVQAADMADVKQVVIQPPDQVTPATAADGAYVLLPNLANIRQLARQLMGG